MSHKKLHGYTNHSDSHFRLHFNLIHNVRFFLLFLNALLTYRIRTRRTNKDMLLFTTHWANIQLFLSPLKYSITITFPKIRRRDTLTTIKFRYSTHWAIEFDGFFLLTFKTLTYTYWWAVRKEKKWVCGRFNTTINSQRYIFIVYMKIILTRSYKAGSTQGNPACFVFIKLLISGLFQWRLGITAVADFRSQQSFLEII